MPAFLAVMRKNLGVEGENLTDFGAQLKLLTDKDRIDLWRNANEIGGDLVCDAPKLSDGLIYSEKSVIGPDGMIVKAE